MTLPGRCTVAAMLLAAAGCASLPPGAAFPKARSSAIAPDNVSLERSLKNPAAADGESGFRLLPNGIDGLTARLEAIGTAEHALDLQYYIFRGDESGRLIAQALLQAADRGVRIRLLVDDGDTVTGDEGVFALAAHPGVEIRIFNPFDYRGHHQALRAVDFALHKPRLDHRMHNKLFVVDNALALIGGRNVGDQYFQIDPTSQFGDDDVVVAGPMVRRLSGVFDQFWNNPLSIPANALDARRTSGAALAAYRAALQSSRGPSAFENDLAARVSSGEPLAGLKTGRTPLVWAAADLAYDSPDKGPVVDGDETGHLIYTEVAARTRKVTRELLMVTPYFVPSPRELALIEALRQRQVSVSLLTNSLPAAPNIAAHAGYTHYRRRLLQSGMQLHEIRPLLGNPTGSGQSRAISRFGNYALHAKLYVFDRQSVFIGSMNFDQRSKRLNTEIGLIISSPELAAATGARFDALTELKNAYELQLRDRSDGRAPELTWIGEVDGVRTQTAIEPARSFWQRASMKFLSWFPFDREL